MGGYKVIIQESPFLGVLGKFPKIYKLQKNFPLIFGSYFVITIGFCAIVNTVFSFFKFIYFIFYFFQIHEFSCFWPIQGVQVLTQPFSLHYIRETPSYPPSGGPVWGINSPHPSSRGGVKLCKKKPKTFQVNFSLFSPFFFSLFSLFFFSFFPSRFP